LLSLFSPRADYRQRGVRIRELAAGDRDLLLVTTGMGPERAAAATQILLDRYPVSHLLSTGYCGGLIPGWVNGEAVLANPLRWLEGPTEEYWPDSALAAKVRAVLSDMKEICRDGPMICSPRPILKTEEKRALAAQNGAAAVEMESGAILETVRISAKKIASVTLRFIVDALEDELTDTGSFLGENAEVKPLRLVREVLRRPRLLKDLPDLGRKANRARERMKRFVGAFFETL
jgi:nucleoside phosphorylase